MDLSPFPGGDFLWGCTKASWVLPRYCMPSWKRTDTNSGQTMMQKEHLCSPKLHSPVLIPPCPRLPSWVVLCRRSGPPLLFCPSLGLISIWIPSAPPCFSPLRGLESLCPVFPHFLILCPANTLSCKWLVFADWFFLSILKELLALWKTSAQNRRTSDKMHY